MKKLFGLKDLLKEQMRDLFDAESQYLRMLPSLIRVATAGSLKDFMQASVAQTQDCASSLARICDLLEVPATGVTCYAMDGLVREAKDTATDWGDTATIDASIIANAQRIAHYEIAGFGTARAFALCLGEKEAAQMLDQMLTRASENDKALTRMATGGWFSQGINHEAARISA